MNGELARALAVGNGVICRSNCGLSDHLISYALRVGHLVSLHRGVYAAAPARADLAVRGRAALVYLGESAVLSHVTALAVWGSIVPGPADPVHAIVPGDVRIRCRGLVVHRRAGTDGVVRRGLRVTRFEVSIVDSWPLLEPDRRRAPVIDAVAGRRTTVDRLRSVVEAARRLDDRQGLVRLLDLLDAGCRSPLEIWGLEHVFTGPGMPAFERQVRVRVGDRSVYLDVYAAVERVDFELDGSASHAGPADRERDLRRDAALAALGIVVVRFTYQRLTREPDTVRLEVLAVLASRRV